MSDSHGQGTDDPEMGAITYSNPVLDTLDVAEVGRCARTPPRIPALSPPLAWFCAQSCSAKAVRVQESGGASADERLFEAEQKSPAGTSSDESRYAARPGFGESDLTCSAYTRTLLTGLRSSGEEYWTREWLGLRVWQT